MREIKFRGIQNHTNQWIYGNLVQNQRGKYIIPFEWVENDGHHLQIISDIPVFVKEETVGEFTGLKSKSGVEIYEGDIIQDEDSISIIDMSNPYWCGNLLTNISQCEVIGNIYQNPELLN